MPFFKAAPSLRSDSSDLDLDGLAESELARLQHQVRLLKAERHAYTLESKETIRRQMVELKRLEKEKDQLLRRQGVAENRITRQKDKDHANSLRVMLGHRDDVEEEIMQEKKKLALLDQEIQSQEKRLAVQKKKVGNGLMIQNQKTRRQKRIQILENELERVTSQFDSHLVVNAQLRDDLDILQVRHDRFGQLYKHLEKKLQDARSSIGTMISSSSAAYDARDEAQNRMSQLRDKTEKDLKQYEIDLKELTRIFEHECLMDEFIGIKLQERQLTEEALKAREKHEQEKKQRRPEEELLVLYQHALKKLEELTGMSTLDAALEKYVAGEERNFAKFTFVNEQNSQMEQLQEQITELNCKIEMVQAQNSQREEEQLSQLREVEAQQEEAVNKIKTTELLLKAQTKIWDVLKSEIASLFRKLQCDTSVLEKALGGSTTARDANVVIYMSLIEQKINELLALYSFMKAEEQQKPFDTVETAQLLLGQKSELSSRRFSVRPPVTGLGHEAITEEDRRPFTHTEIREKILKEIQSKAETLSQRKNTQADITSNREWASGNKKPIRFSLT